MPGAVGPDVGATRLTIGVGGDPLQDGAQRLVGLRGASRHDRGPLQRTDLTARDARPDEVETEVTQALLASAGVLEV